MAYAQFIQYMPNGDILTDDLTVETVAELDAMVNAEHLERGASLRVTCPELDYSRHIARRADDIGYNVYSL